MNTKNRGLRRVLVSFVMLVLLVLGLTLWAAADDISINLLTDDNSGYRLERYRFDLAEEEDGTVYTYNRPGENAALYAFDDENLMGSYFTFSLEGDFYFDAFPSGLRDGTTAEENPLSFLCWIYTRLDTGKPGVFNSLRLDNNGYLYTQAASPVKTDVQLETGRWYNIRCVFTPKNGISEVFIDGEKRFDFKIEPYRPGKYISHAVRYFDGFFNWDVKMKNLYFKTDSSYSVELKREAAADYMGYQVTKPEGDSFTARAVLGLDSLDYRRVGYETLILARDEEGNVMTESRSEGTATVYQTLRDADGNTYNVSELYGRKYAAALDISELALEPDFATYEIVIRPYVLGNDGIRRYGVATTLYYIGELDEAGYPILHKNEGKILTVECTDDTFIWNKNGYQSSDQGSATMMMFRNPGTPNNDGYRACYFQFTLDAETVKALDTAASAKLRVYIPSIDSNIYRKLYDVVVHATKSGWNEHDLNFQNHTSMATTMELVGQGPCRAASYFSIDVLSYLRSEMVNEDGTMTVSFQLTSEGKDDALEVFVYSRETTFKPILEISNSIYEISTNLDKMANVGYEPWGYAEALVDEWFEELYYEVWNVDMFGESQDHGEVGDFAPKGYGEKSAAGDFTVPVNWLNNGIWSTNKAEGYIYGKEYLRGDKFARTLSTLGTSTANAFLKSSYAEMRAEYDAYGGITNAGFTGEATGFFHTEVHNGRCYIIDPLGNPYFAFGMNEVGLGADNHIGYSLDAYGSEENFYKQMTADLLDLGINTAFVSTTDELLKVENGLSCVVGIDVIGHYMSRIGRAKVSEGQFPYNNTMNVFDPDFVTVAEQYVAGKIEKGGYADDPNIFGYTTDNELPAARDLLGGYLTLNPAEEATNAFSYAVAWTWLARRMELDNPTLSDYLNSPERERMAQEFFSFVYARYYKVARDAIRASDPNHMYLGSRVAGDCKVNEGYHRAAGYYLDVITVNLYDGMNPAAETISNIYRYSGKPFIVTEFYAMSFDAIDANGWMLASSTGAGAFVFTQKDRATYYEHYVLSLLESKACVGWIWYRLRDCDQSIYRSINLDKELIMLDSDGAETVVANTFMDKEGTIYNAAEVGFYDTVYQGNLINSNQNSNKGLYNSDFSSNVMVYQYDARGELVSYKGYEVEHPDSETPADGTVLRATEGDMTFTLGSVTNADGTRSETVLTAYRGRYVALASSIRALSSHIIGLVRYFDAK